jgi:signal transduction histidine kinase
VRHLVSVGNTLYIGTDKTVAAYTDGDLSEAEGLPGAVRSLVRFGKSVLAVTSERIYGSPAAANHFHQIAWKQEFETPYSTVLASDDVWLLGTEGRGLLEVRDSKESIASARPYFINVLARDGDSNVWIGADTGNRSGGLFLRGENGVSQVGGSGVGSVTSISFENSGRRTWVGTDTSGIFLVENSVPSVNYTFASTGGGLRSNKVYSLYVDRENTVWIGTNRGVSRFDTGSPNNESLSDESQSDFVRVLFKSPDGRVLAGTNRGLFALESGYWRAEGSISGQTVYTIVPGPDGNLFTGTKEMFCGVDGKPILEGDVRGAGWVGGTPYAAVFGEGLVRPAEGDDEEKVVFGDEGIISSLNDEGSLLLGTSKGEVFRFDGSPAKKLGGLGAMANQAVWQIRRSGDDLVFATQSGVFVYRNGKAERYLEGIVVRDAYVEGPEIWAATVDSGLFHIRKDDKFGNLQANISIEQGLPSAAVFALLPIEDGSLMIGTAQGISYYKPNTKPPSILVTRLLSQRLYSNTEMKRGIALDFPQNSLLLEVEGISSRTFPEKFQYAFVLKGKDGKVIRDQLTGNAQFVMDDLKAGDYFVEAYAFNQDLVRSEPLTFSFSVAAAPFPWTSTALGTLLVVALIALAWAVVERRRITDVNRKLTAARLDLANEAERERRRIARDLHDQTLADLRHLMLKSDEVSGEDSQFRGEIESISEEIRRICEDLSPSVLENVGFLAALEFLLAGSEMETDFTVAKGSEEELSFSPSVQMQIFRIAQEVISNIRQHAEATKISVQVNVDGESGFLLRIEDDGREEFDPDGTGHSGRGLSNIRSRASLVEAEVSWKRNQDGPGYEFSLQKPG